MDCETYEALAVDLLYGGLSPERRAEAQSHAASCAECGKLHRELDEARQMAASLPARIAPPRALDERVMLAARVAADVRQQPLRGSGLHVAAAAVLAALLIGVSFAVGMNVEKKHIFAGPGDADDRPLVSPNRGGHTIDTADGPEVDSRQPRRRPNMSDIDWSKYQVQLLAAGKDDLGKGQFERALTSFGGAFSSGRSHRTLEARVGMAKALRGLGRLEEARIAARDAREKNGDWGTNFDDIEAEASKLIREINVELDEQNKKKLQQR